uniref:poly(A)-specific ribonuclease n=1 Tax=Leersia perrieri TaxID=77586 RepID=A0A0D9XHI8_9ORYZ
MAASSLSMAPPPPPLMTTTPLFFYTHQRPPNVRVIKITSHNLHQELAVIASLLPRFPFVAVDTEFPGEVHHHQQRGLFGLTPDEQYTVVKANTDELHLLQLGITICDASGHLPVALDFDGSAVELTWEVDFSDFDLHRHRHAQESVAFLRAQGFDFVAARHAGVRAAAFAAALHVAGGILQLARGGGVTWITFGGMYDLAFLIKLVTGGAPLPETRAGFVARVGVFLGHQVFDGRLMARSAPFGFHGSVTAVADTLRLPPLLPRLHLAGPNSVMALHVFMELRRRLLHSGGHGVFSLQIEGLT